jgi:hypothetical protein
MLSIRDGDQFADEVMAEFRGKGFCLRQIIILSKSSQLFLERNSINKTAKGLRFALVRSDYANIRSASILMKNAS